MFVKINTWDLKNTLHKNFDNRHYQNPRANYIDESKTDYQIKIKLTLFCLVIVVIMVVL